MVKDDNDVNSTEDIDNPPNIGGVQLKYGDGDPVEYEEIERIKSMSNDVAKGNPGSVFRKIGIVAILYGISVGVFILFGSLQESPPLYIDSWGFFIDSAIRFLLALGSALIFVVPGVICIGVSRIINLLAK